MQANHIFYMVSRGYSIFRCSTKDGPAPLRRFGVKIGKKVSLGLFYRWDDLDLHYSMVSGTLAQIAIFSQ
jgi:hypothetical protein